LTLIPEIEEEIWRSQGFFVPLHNKDYHKSLNRKFMNEDRVQELRLKLNDKETEASEEFEKGKKLP